MSKFRDICWAVKAWIWWRCDEWKNWWVWKKLKRGRKR